MVVSVCLYSWDFLVDKIIQLTELYVPENKLSGQSDWENPFINQSCIEAIRAKNTKWQKYKHCTSNINYDHYKAARNRVTAELRYAKYNFEQNLAAKIKTDGSWTSRPIANSAHTYKIALVLIQRLIITTTTTTTTTTTMSSYKLCLILLLKHFLSSCNHLYKYDFCSMYSVALLEYLYGKDLLCL